MSQMLTIAYNLFQMLLSRFQGLTNYLDKNAERHAKNWGCIWNRDIDDLLRQADIGEF